MPDVKRMAAIEIASGQSVIGCLCYYIIDGRHLIGLTPVVLLDYSPAHALMLAQAEC